MGTHDGTKYQVSWTVDVKKVTTGDHRGQLPRQLWWTLVELRAPCCRSCCSGFLPGFLLKVQSFGLVVESVEKKACKTQIWTPKRNFFTTEFTKNFRFKEPLHLTLIKELVWILFIKTRLKFKEKTLAFCYDKNFTFIYFLHLVKFISLDCLSIFRV